MSDYARRQADLWDACADFQDKYPVGTVMIYEDREVVIRTVPTVLANEACVYVEGISCHLRLEELSKK